jgi:Subtilase family
MPTQPNDKRLHIILTNTAVPQPFTSPVSGGGTPELPERDRAQHAGKLRGDLASLKNMAAQVTQLQQQQNLESGFGLQIEFVGFPDVALAFESLENSPNKIELLSVKTNGATTTANVFVPDGKLAHFEKYITDYLAERRSKAQPGKPTKALDHKALLNTISAIRRSSIKALWEDDEDQLPQDPNHSFWWEVWLPIRNNRDAVLADFRKLAELAGCQLSAHHAKFPERTVIWMRGSQNQFQNAIGALNCVAELRRAKDTAEFFDGLAPIEQAGWVEAALPRMQIPDDDDSVPRICLLDSGINRGHPLLAPFIATADLHTANPHWGKDDEANHGTGLASLALVGDLTAVLAHNEAIPVLHRLESVKIISQGGDNTEGEHSHAAILGDAVSQPEIDAPQRPRVFASAVSATDYRDRGKPSSWSAKMDSLAADADGEGRFPRLFIVSSGNIVDGRAWATYPDSLSTNLIHDPGQAWNAITVGAFTNKFDTENLSLQPVAQRGGLSPFTTTSAAWDSAWPLKPDVVMEGGNVSRDASGFCGKQASLALLVTNNKPIERLLTTSNATSAATALCARLAAQLMAAYPSLRPETVRGLIVHSAQWTAAMRKMYLPANKSANKTHRTNLIRHCGWGTPDLQRALWSAGNSLTLIAEDLIYPFKKEDGTIKTRDMNLHSLPWQKKALLELGAIKVRLRITLSYFIEPNPSARGEKSKFHYPSHRLRFDVQRPLEKTADFVTRMNAAAGQEDEGGNPLNPQDADWALGDRQRHKGSLHQDEWEGTAANLADCGYIAVYPGNGWWRTRTALKRHDSPARYSLIVSIHTEQTETDIYSIVEQAIATQIAIAIRI